MFFSVRHRGLAVLVAILVFVVSVPPAQAQDDMLRTTAQLPNAKKLEAMEAVDAASIIATLNEGMFALECASPQKMRAIVMFITDEDVMRIEGEVIEMEPGSHSVEGVMPGDNVSEVWGKLTGGEPLRAVKVYEADKPFESERHIIDAVRDKVRQSRKKIENIGTASLVMFLAPANGTPERLSSERVRIYPMAVLFGDAG